MPDALLSPYMNILSIASQQLCEVNTFVSPSSEEETEAERSWATYPRSHPYEVMPTSICSCPQCYPALPLDMIKEPTFLQTYCWASFAVRFTSKDKAGCPFTYTCAGFVELPPFYIFNYHFTFFLRFVKEGLSPFVLLCLYATLPTGWVLKLQCLHLSFKFITLQSYQISFCYSVSWPDSSSSHK